MFIRQMSYLVALARERHFGRAAAACDVTQSTLSTGLKSLERELNMRLVIREPQFAGLTPEGERVAEWASQIIMDFESLKQDAGEYPKGLRGNLRLGVIPAAMPLVAQLTAPFIARHPNVTIDVREMTSGEVQRGLDKFEIDSGVTYLENEPLSRVRKRALYRERYVFVTDRSSVHAVRGAITWRDAVQHNLCLLNETMQNRRVLNNLAESLGLVMKPSITTNSYLAVCSHVGEWRMVEHNSAYIRIYIFRL